MTIPIVVTSINEPTLAVTQFDKINEFQVVYVSDLKSPVNIEIRGRVVSIEDQKASSFNLVPLLPFNHYSRKNIGYLIAAASGPKFIFETDDDNLPTDNWLSELTASMSEIKANEYRCDNVFLNPYEYFTDSKIWPRGYPLKYINTETKGRETRANVAVHVWQGLADEDPDVDAVYRLTSNQFTYFRNNRIAVPRSVYAPFNSQNTLWSECSFFAMYLPITVTFRFTDILRGYVAKRLFDQFDITLGFHGPTVKQERNEHDLMKDFSDEVPMYMYGEAICAGLEKLTLSNLDKYNALIVCYEWLFDHGHVQIEDVYGVKAWAADLKDLLNE